MPKKEVELKVCLDALGLSIDMDDFESRLILQKSIYLLQEFGLDLGYRYNWYLRGPYSSSLADTGFGLSRNHKKIEEVIQKARLKEDAQDIINKCKKFFLETSEPEDMTRAAWLELLASLHYLKKYTFQGKNTKNAEQLLKLLKSKKDWYDQADIEQAIQVLIKNELIHFDS